MFAALGVIRFLACGLVYRINNIITDSLDLSEGACFAEDEEVGDRFIDLPKVKTDDFLALLFLDCSNYSLEKFARAGSAAGGFGTSLKGCDDFLQMKRFCR